LHKRNSFGASAVGRSRGSEQAFVKMAAWRAPKEKPGARTGFLLSELFEPFSI